MTGHLLQKGINCMDTRSSAAAYTENFSVQFCMNTYSNRPYLLHKYTEGSRWVSSSRSGIMYGYPLPQQIFSFLHQTGRIVKVSSLIKDILIWDMVFLDVTLYNLTGNSVSDQNADSIFRAWKMVTAVSSEMFAPTYQAKLCHIQEDCDLNIHCHKAFKSHNLVTFYLSQQYYNLDYIL